MRTKQSLQTIAQAAQQIDCRRQWVHYLITSGRVPGAFKSGGTWLVPRPFKYISKTS